MEAEIDLSDLPDYQGWPSTLQVPNHCKIHISSLLRKVWKIIE